MTYTRDELMPTTGEPEPVDGFDERELERRAGAVLGIYVANPLHRKPFEAMDRLRATTFGRKGQRQYALRITGASGSGKSTLAKRFVQVVDARGLHQSGERPVAYVELEQACTVKRMWSAILQAYNDDFAEDGSLENLRRRALAAIERERTRLLIIDEVQQLFYRSKDGLAATDAFKRLLDSGVVSVALLGDPTGRTLLQSNPQLVNRMVPPSDIAPLEAHRTAHLSMLSGFMKRYDARLVEHGLHDEVSGLHDPRTVAALMEASAGVLGVCVNVVREASDRAYRRRARRIEPCDLAWAAEALRDAQGRNGRNPFVKS